MLFLRFLWLGFLLHFEAYALLPSKMVKYGCDKRLAYLADGSWYKDISNTAITQMAYQVYSIVPVSIPRASLN